MAILNIVQLGDPLLRKVSAPVWAITPQIKQLVSDMIDTMHDSGGCGISAVQVGVLSRIVVVEVESGNPIVLINPKITASAGNQYRSEGCLSIPGTFGITRRPKTVTVQAIDLDGKEVEYTGSDLLACAFCHEIDHLDGKLFTDCLINKKDK